MTYPFYIKVEHHAASIPPQEAVRILAAEAKRLQMTLTCDINGIHVMAMPESDPEALATSFGKALKYGTGIATA